MFRKDGKGVVASLFSGFYTNGGTFVHASGSILAQVSVSQDLLPRDLLRLRYAAAATLVSTPNDQFSGALFVSTTHGSEWVNSD
jgi:hypothetical protein